MNNKYYGKGDNMKVNQQNICNRVDKRNVLVVAPSMHIGGLEMVIYNICKTIDKHKFNIHLCCLKELGTIGEALIKNGCSITVLKKPTYMKTNYITWLQILSIIREKNIHVIHSHTTDSLLDATLCKLVASNVKAIHTFHYGNYPKLPKRYLYIEKYCSRIVDQLIAVGNEQKNRIISSLNIERDAIITIWNGVPSATEKPERSIVEKYRREGRVIIGTVCTLIEQKGLTHLIDVAQLLKQKGVCALFLIAGEGNMRNVLEEKVNRLQLNDEVIFMGWVENASTSFIPYIDIFFLPSLWEAMSVVVLEAMEAGKPVVVTDVGENKHVITDGVDGFVKTIGDNEAMAKTLNDLIENTGLRECTGEMARKTIRERFRVENMVRAYERLYETDYNFQR